LSLPASGASIKNVIDMLRAALAQRRISHINDEKMRVSAVLVPIFLKAGQYHLLFIQRTERVREHKGQISFPGGAYEKVDRILLNTALREAEEEIGLAPVDVDVLGELDDVVTASTNYVISPFVGLIPYPYKFKPDKWETEELIEVPISVLQSKDCFSDSMVKLNGLEIETGFFKCRDKIIWGATSKILKQFLEIVAGLPIS
jgi:8-oxo-dGTP pyrophosphatase MutT (NUDIX family)